MEYQGVKFETIFQSEDPEFDERIEDLKYWCSIFEHNDLAPLHPDGSYGNLSYRDKSNSDEFIITCSGAYITNNMDLDSFVRVTDIDIIRNRVYSRGKRKPSSESFLHFLIYQNRKEINAIFHGHSSAILSAPKSLGLPCTKSRKEYGTIVLAENVINVLDDHDFLILKEHGFLALGKTMRKAGKLSLDILKKTQKEKNNENS